MVKLTEDFSIGLTRCCTFILKLHSCCSEAHSGEVWGQRNGGRRGGGPRLYMRPVLQSAVFPNLVHRGGNIQSWYASEYSTLRTTYISHSGWLVVQTRLCVGGSYCFASAWVDTVWSNDGNQADNNTEYWSSSGHQSTFFWWQMKLHLTKRQVNGKKTKKEQSLGGRQSNDRQLAKRAKRKVSSAESTGHGLNLPQDWAWGQSQEKAAGKKECQRRCIGGARPLDRLPECQK